MWRLPSPRAEVEDLEQTHWSLLRPVYAWRPFGFWHDSLYTPGMSQTADREVRS